MLYGSTSCKLVERGGKMGWFAVEKDAVLRQDLFGWFRKVE